MASPGFSRPSGRKIGVFELRPIQEISQRRAEIGFERHRAAGDFDRLLIERVIQIEHEVGSRRIGRARRGRGHRRRPEYAGGAAVAIQIRVERRHAQKRREREAKVGRVELLGRLLRSMRFSHRDERHAQAVRVIVIPQALHLVVADELKPVEVVVVPTLAVQHDVVRAEVIGRLDRARRARPNFAVLANKPQHAFERFVVEVRSAAELRIVVVDRQFSLIVEQVAVSVSQGRGVDTRAPARSASSPGKTSDCLAVTYASSAIAYSFSRCGSRC